MRCPKEQCGSHTRRPFKNVLGVRRHLAKQHGLTVAEQRRIAALHP